MLWRQAATVLSLVEAEEAHRLNTLPTSSAPCRISVMGGEQAATVLSLVEAEKRAREGQEWPEDEREYFKERIRQR